MSNQPTLSFRIRQLLHHGVVFGLTTSLQSALGFLLLPLYTKYLNVEEFGNYNMLLIIAATCNTIFGLGASSALGRYYYEYKEIGKEKEIVSAALWISFLGAILLILIGLLSAYPVCTYYLNDVSLQIPYVLCLSANSLSYPLITLTLLLRYKKQSMFYLIITVLGLLLNFGFTIFILIFSEIKICAPFIGMFISNIVLLFFLILKERKQLTLHVQNREYRIILIFGIQIIISAFLSYIYDCSDKIVMKEMLSVSEVGIYSLGGRIGSLYRLLVYVPFALIWAPLRMEYKNSPDNKFFVRKITNYYSLCGIILILICMIWGYDFLKHLFPQSEYLLSLKIFPLCMLGYFFYGYLSIFDFGVFIYNKLFYLSIIPIFCLVVNTGLNIWLLPLFGIEASAYIYVLTYILSSFLLLHFSNKYYLIPMDWPRLLGMYSVWIIVYVLFFAIELSVTHLLWMKIFCSLIILGITWRFFMTNQERKFLINKLKRIGL